MLVRAGAAVVLAAAGKMAAALAHATKVAQSACASPVLQGVAALAIVSEVLARSPDRALLEQSRAMLASRGDSQVIIGGAAACLGPVSRYSAALETDGARRMDMLQAACAFADRSDALLWRIVTRRDLHRATAEPRFLAEARALAPPALIGLIDTEIAVGT